VVHAHPAEAGAEPLQLIVWSSGSCLCSEYVTIKLLIFYATIWELGIAQKVFDRMPERSVVAWNTMIFGWARGGEEARAVEWFDVMCADGLQPDQLTFGSVLCAFARRAALELGRCVHDVAVKLDVGTNVLTNSMLMDTYLKRSSPENAHSAFTVAPERNVTMWTAVIFGHIAEALVFFNRMMEDGFRPNDVTILAVLSPHVNETRV
jgi:pentatricopeptide repeat protein